MIDRTHIRIILQARTTSTRLPAKVLLPLGNECLAIMCAKRLAVCGREVILATSDDPSDDLLANMAVRGGVSLYRGSLLNVRQRFLDCASDLPDEAIIVRATADNPIPDGHFVEALLAYFTAGALEYLGTNSPADGLPYGLSAEVFRVGALRKCKSVDSIDIEHVTPSLKCKAGIKGILPLGFFYNENRSSLRITIDTLQDYLISSEIFSELQADVMTPWNVVVDHAWSKIHGNNCIGVQRRGKSHVSTLILGTAQLGMNYGATNFSGQPDDREAKAILRTAINGGITHIDTAQVYGDAENRIGTLLDVGQAQRVRVITKLPSLGALSDCINPSEVLSCVDLHIEKSLARLRRQQLDVLMFHQCADMFRWHGLVMDRLSEHVSMGGIAELGVSVYSPEDACSGLADSRIKHIQIPFNLLDGRWLKSQFIEAIASRPDVCVHVRSVFLQGLLINDSSLWPSWCASSSSLVSRIDAFVERFSRRDRADLCMAYVRGFPWVTSMVVGVESVSQLEHLIACQAEPSLTESQCRQVKNDFIDIPHRLINPSLW